LEATFYVPSPDGEMEPQRWWIECKGRKGTVDPQDVKGAIINAAVLGDLAYLVLVTNTTFSNPTRDWVKTWQSSRPRPKIKLWDHEMLERLLSRQPAVVLRLFSEALSPTGLLKVTGQRFWEKLEYAPVRALRTFWAARETIEIDQMGLVALLANEFAHGSIIDRPWAARAAPPHLLAALQTALVNMPYFRVRAAKIGIDEEPIFAAVAHMILVLLQRIDAKSLAELVVKSVGERDGKEFPDNVVEIILMPILNRLVGEMQDVCSADCDRLLGTEKMTLEADPDPVDIYWKRLDPSGELVDIEPKRFLLIERHDAPCKVGFPLNKERGCPLYETKPSTKDVPLFLSIIERVSKFRLGEAEEAAREKAIRERERAAARAKTRDEAS
jgi:hypothetical protein